MSSVRTAHHHHHHHPRIPNDVRLCFGSSPTCKAPVIRCRWSDFIWRENRREVDYWATVRRVSDSIRLAIGLGTKSHGEMIHVVPPLPPLAPHPPYPRPLWVSVSRFCTSHLFISVTVTQPRSLFPRTPPPPPPPASSLTWLDWKNRKAPEIWSGRYI